MVQFLGVVYDITNSSDREELHKSIDKWLEDNYEELLMSGEIDEELSRVHEIISEQESDLLDGKWFKNTVTIEHWYEPITDFLGEMDFEYVVCKDGDINAYVNGITVVFTRKTKHAEDDEYTKYISCPSGIVEKEVLELLGMSYVKDYYIPRVS